MCASVIKWGWGSSRQCKSLPACHLTPAGVMLWHIGKWGGRVDKDFNRILKWVMVAFMCVIVTYPKVTAPKRHHPSPACLPHASFCLTDSLKLCLFVCSQSHFHLWSSWAWVTIARSALRHWNRQTGAGNLLRNCSPALKAVILDITLVWNYFCTLSSQQKGEKNDVVSEDSFFTLTLKPAVNLS